MLARVVELQGPTDGLTMSVARGKADLTFHSRLLHSWPTVEVEALTTSAAETVTRTTGLVVIGQAAPTALKVLRDHGVSYVTRSGEWHVVDPPDRVIITPPKRPATITPSSARPLGRGTARVARYLLLFPNGPVTVTGLAQAVGVSEATSSRAVAHLADRALVDVTVDEDARRRAVRIVDPAALLETVAGESTWPRARRMTWDIGENSFKDALTAIRRATASEPTALYALGGLAGASLRRVRLAEPAAATMWIAHDEVAPWQDLLLARQARPAPGTIDVRLAPDPQILAWADVIDGVAVADPVQLYVDCRYGGERAIDTADAMSRLVLDR